MVDDPTVQLSSPTFDEKNVELSSMIADATYNYILGKIDTDGFKDVIERWKNSGGDQIMEEYNEALASEH
ncbi:Lipoprotein LipO precursor [compost metagenome]